MSPRRKLLVDLESHLYNDQDNLGSMRARMGKVLNIRFTTIQEPAIVTKKRGQSCVPQEVLEGGQQ